MSTQTNPERPDPAAEGSSVPAGRVILVVLAGVAAIGALVALAFLGGDAGTDGSGGGDGPDLALDDPTAPSVAGEPDAATPADQPVGDDPDDLVVGPDTAGLARAAVLLLQLDDRGEPACFSGSGSLIEATGRILTNAHVVWNDPTCPYEKLGVAIVEATDQPPTLRYLADVVALDENLDLAVVQIATDLSGQPTGEISLPHIAIGDSDLVELGDTLRILGFPGIGGNTITFTQGAVSGFVAQRGVDVARAWIKTDATIAGGNSGGMAVNEAGELVAVPTTSGAGDAAATDCRVIEDTNGDGFIDEDDPCIPIGGFINGLRPVNLAVALLAGAENGQVLEPVSPDVGPGADFDIDQVVIDRIYFAPDVTDDNQPTETVHALPVGAPRVCAFWTYSGMRDGVAYDAIWRIDGTPDTDASFLGDLWAGGESGEWWVCAIDDTGLAAGLYEFELTVEEQFLASEALFVGGDRAPASITIDNQSSDTICYVQISPTLAGYWGGDELGSTDVIEGFTSRTFADLVTGQYDILLRDCDLDPLDEWNAIDLVGDATLVRTG